MPGSLPKLSLVTDVTKFNLGNILGLFIFGTSKMVNLSVFDHKGDLHKQTLLT